MSDKRKLSGNDFLKVRKKKKQEDIVTGGQLMSWLALPSTSDKVQPVNCECDDSNKNQEDQSLIIVESPEEYAIAEEKLSENVNKSEEVTVADIESDPVDWIIDNNFRDMVCRNGFKQNKELDFSGTRVESGGQARALNLENFRRKLPNGEYQDRDWLIFSQKKQRIFCGPCRIFSKEDVALTTTGFNDWKNIVRCLNSHEESFAHKDHLVSFKKRGKELHSVNAKVILQLNKEVIYWRNVLHRVVEVIKSLAMRNLPFWGSDESFGSPHNGNFLMMIETLAIFDPFLEEHIKKFGNPGKGRTSYLSSTTCDEFINLMAKQVLEKIIAEVKMNKHFSIIVDSTPDVSHTDQLAMILRYVNKQGKPVERFVGFLPNVGHAGEDMFNAIKKMLKTWDLDIKNCRGQSYDNAANMSGVYKGLKSRIQEESPLADFIPCAGHSLNLVGTHAVDCCEEAVSFFSLIQGIYNFFAMSTSRWELLMRTSQSTLKGLSATRWSARYDACRALKKNWMEVTKTLDLIENDEAQKSGIF